MAGTMREKSAGVWELRVQAGRDPLTGKYRQQSKTFRGSKAAASKLLAKLVTEAESLGPNASTALFADLLTKWLDLRSPAMSPLTVARYKIAIDTHIIPALGDRQVRRLRSEHFDYFYAALGTQMKPASVLKIHHVCSAALNQAVKWGWIARNVTEQAQKPKLLKEPHELPNFDEVRAFLERAAEFDPNFGRLIWVKLALGLRRGEVCALRKDDVDFANKTVRINWQIVQTPDRQLVLRQPKWNSRRTIAVDDATLNVLRAQIESADPAAARNKKAFLWSDALDGSVAWKPMRVTRALGRLRRPDEETNWPGIQLRLHDLRHLNGTHLSDLGVDIATISYRLGHSRISTTADLYVQRVNESDRAAAGIFSKKLLS